MKKSFLIATLLAVSTLAVAAPKKHAQYEPNDPKAPQQTVDANIFMGKKVTASGQYTNFTPNRVVDGKTNDVQQHWACENLPVWVQIDLEKSEDLSAIRIFPYWADGRIYTYKIEGSLDGKTWKMLVDMTANSIASSAEGQAFTFPTEKVRYVKTTILSNSRGAQSGGHIIEIQGFNTPISKELIDIAVVSPLNRFQKTDALPKSTPAKIEVSGWKGERVYAQVLVNAKNPVQRLTAKLKNVDGEVNFVRYTLANNKLTADILDDAETLPVPTGTLRPVFLTIDIPQGATGDLNGVLEIQADAEIKTIPVVVKVEAGTLPKPTEWKMHVDIWQHPDAIARWHDVKKYSDAHFALMASYAKRLANIGQKVVTCTLIEDAWNGQTYDEFASMVKITKKKDGSWAYDYTIFDRYIQMMMNAGINQQIDCYTMIPWHLKFTYFDEATQTFVAPKLNPGSPEYEAFWGPYLTDLAAHAKQKGWFKIIKIAMDERPDHLMKAAHALVKKYAPGMHIVGAFNYPTKLTDNVEVISLALNHTDGLTQEIKSMRAGKGYKTTMYTCCGPHRPNTFTFSPLAEPIWLGHYTAAQNLDGYLRWAYSSWVENPLVSTDFVTWPTGDCFLVYPGDRSSLRLEMLRDGFEDYEKIRILRADAEKDTRENVKTALKRLNDELIARGTYKYACSQAVLDNDVAVIRQCISDLTKALYTK